MTSNDALGLADKISFQIKYYPDARLTAEEARLVIAQLRSPRAVPANGAGREALEHAHVRFQCLADHFKEVGEDALWAMSEVDAEWMEKALASPVVGRAENEQTSVHNAAQALLDSLKSQFVSREIFSIAVGANCLHAYIRCPKNRWPVSIPDTSKGIPIEWHWDVGPAIAGSLPTPPLNPPAPPNGETGISAVGGGE